MKRLSLIFFYFLLKFTHTSAQNIIKGFVIDSKSKQPLEYVTIVTKQGDVGAYSDEKGYFELSTPATDSIIVSSIGYKKELLAIDKRNQTTDLKTIQLTTISTQLPELKISSSKKTKVKEIGLIKAKSNNIYIFGNPGYKRAVFVPNENNDNDDIYIKELIYPFHSSWQKGEATVRVHLYKINPHSIDKAPGDELLPENIVIKFKPTSKLKVDISKYAIKFLDEGVFVGLEWLEGEVFKRFQYYNTGAVAPVIKSTNEYPLANSWVVWAFKSRKWEKSIKSVNLHVNPSNSMFGLTIVK